jgi:hypothetical protein
MASAPSVLPAAAPACRRRPCRPRSRRSSAKPGRRWAHSLSIKASAGNAGWCRSATDTCPPNTHRALRTNAELMIRSETRSNNLVLT